ncbi:MAG: 3'-5' exoribonuclease [archaeon]
MTTEIYLSTDIEADGPIPGEYSMLSLGSVVVDKDGKIQGEFYKKLKPLQGAKQHPETMKFWKESLGAWKEATSDQEDPKKVMGEYVEWYYTFRSDSDEQRLLFLTWPATFDFMSIYWYMIKFVEKHKREFRKQLPFFLARLDIRSLAMVSLKQNYLDTHLETLPERWIKDAGEHTHKAIDDAKQHAKIFINILKENKK